LPIVETEAQNLSAYIPTNLISITDGQIYLSPDLFRKGVLPAIEVGRSVSRVGGKTQLPAYRAVAGDLKLAYSQFQELEAFARFGTRLEEETRKSLERGRRVREILKQAQYEPLPVPQQLAALIAINHGLFDKVPIERVTVVEAAVRQVVAEQLPEVCERIQAGKPMEDDDLRSVIEVARDVIETKRASHPRPEIDEHDSEVALRPKDDSGGD
jgi:F-type H+-transporting ATPase subunit alpha